MITHYQKSELEIASELMHDGFVSAKKTFEQVLQTPVAIQQILDENQSIKKLSQSGNEIQVFKTQLRGDIAGSCYLLFTEDEVQEILNTCLPGHESMGESSENLVSGFLSEVDNMVAAAVVTEFANYLGVLMYGDVPEHITVKSSQIENYVNLEEYVFDGVIHYKAIFNGTKLSISPHFIWMFQSELLERIKEIITSN